MLVFLAVYTVVIVVATWILAHDPGFFGNVGFLIFGSLLGIYPAFIIEEIKRRREASSLANALFQELAKLVGGCCFDFEKPWKDLIAREQSIPVDRLRKFIPAPPVIYPALASRISLLRVDQAQAIVDFYLSFAAWRRDATDIADEFTEKKQDLPGKRVAFVGERLRRTLAPGQRALEALARDVSGAEEIERNALRDSDQMFPQDHSNAGKTIRERISLVVQR